MLQGFRRLSTESELLHLLSRLPAAICAALVLGVFGVAVLLAPLIVSIAPFDLRAFDILDSLLPPA